MKWKRIHIVICLVCFAMSASGQQRKYTAANAHSHNDYENPQPFDSAYNAGFGSIEVDIHLKDGWLVVAHNSVEYQQTRTLTQLYLDPLMRAIIKNKGSAYPDRRKQLILLIDIKTAAEPTLDALLVLLELHGKLFQTPSLKIVITGNRPPPAKWSSYPKWLYFDGRPNEQYDVKALSRVALISDNYKFYSDTSISAAVKKAHALKKPIRFWATPDNADAWRQLMQLDVDYINTDKIGELAEFLRNVGN